MSNNSPRIGSRHSTGGPTVTSIHVGQVQSLDANNDINEKPWTSGIIKQAVVGPVVVCFTNVEGDQQADLVHHGGPDKAVLAYPQENYSFWQREFPTVQWQDGCFGENLTLHDATEDDVCLGDVYSLGECLLQISQPRQPCWKLSRRWNLPKLAVRVQQTRRTGWYLRVLQEGEIEAGQTMKLVERPLPQWTITACNEVMFAKPRDASRDLALASCKELSTSWQQTLSKRSSKLVDGAQVQKRLRGEE